VQLQDSRKFKIAVTKSCCPVCWEIVTIFNRQNETTQEQGSDSGDHTFPVHFDARGRHPILYPVDLPDILDESIKDELLTKFRITLLRNLACLLDKETTKAANTKHLRSESNISQPESVAFSVDSSFGGSIDVGTSQGNQQYISEKRQKEFVDVESWRKSSCNPEPSK
jgi:hypothetical protein